MVKKLFQRFTKKIKNKGQIKEFRTEIVIKIKGDKLYMSSGKVPIFHFMAA